MANLSPETRGRILAVAERLFAEMPFDQVRMEDIAKGAEIGKVTIYRYFPTKDDLYHDLLRQIGDQYLSMLHEAEAAVRGCRTRLVALVRTAMSFFGERPHLIKLLDRAGIDTDRGKNFPWVEVQREFFRVLRGLFAEGVFKGEFQVDDLELPVRALIGAMRFQHLYPCDEMSREEFPERIVNMLVRPAKSLHSTRTA